MKMNKKCKKSGIVTVASDKKSLLCAGRKVDKFLARKTKLKIWVSAL